MSLYVVVLEAVIFSEPLGGKYPPPEVLNFPLKKFCLLLICTFSLPTKAISSPKLE